jgi:probable rRNA maturation factor
MSEGGPVVVVVDEQSDVSVDGDRWGRLAAQSLRSSGVTAGELNLLFVDEATIHDLNRRHLDEDRPTDVLSFPIDGADAPDGAEALIGDVVVCPAYAARQAADHAGQRGHTGTLDDELALLIVHGVLHVLGHDHAEPEETRVMQAREQELLAAHHGP